VINSSEKFLGQNEHRNFLYMTMDDESEILPDLEMFLRVLKKIPKLGLDWEYHYWPEEDHASTPYRSIYSGLRALFQEWNEIPPDVAFKGLEEIKKHEVSLKQSFGYDIGVSTAALRKAGQEHQRNQEYEKAVAIYKYAIEKQPGDAFAYVTLGRAYEESGMLLPARDAFQKAYELAVAAAEPQVKWIKNFLDGINQKITDAKK
jgi:tetratricopeptide (TPR) repeat protein